MLNLLNTEPSNQHFDEIANEHAPAHSIVRKVENHIEDLGCCSLAPGGISHQKCCQRWSDTARFA
jgi:hypothetical protein